MAELKTEPVENYYDVKEELGRGRFAVVKKCMSKKNNELYAAKFVRKARQGRSCREQLLLEIDILHTSSHPKMVRLYDVFETRKEMIIIIEYAPGGDLHRHCLEQVETVRTEKEICYLIRQIVEAVQYLHNNKVVHLDLKPENILLSSEERFPEIRLIDFGLSRRLDVPYSQFDIVGTPEYVAPEVLAFEPLEYASDMWSIGVVAYVLLSGISPFAGDEVMETYQNVAQVDYDFDAEEFDEISDDAKDFIDKLLIRKPKDRMTTREALEHPWLKQMENGYKEEDVAAALVAEKIVYESESEEEEEEDEEQGEEERNSLDDEEDSGADNKSSGLQSEDGLSECSLLKSEGAVSSDEIDIGSYDDTNDEERTNDEESHDEEAIQLEKEVKAIDDDKPSIKHDRYILKPLDINDNNKILKAGDSSSDNITPSTPPFSDGTPDSRTPDSDFADKDLSASSITKPADRDSESLTSSSPCDVGENDTEASSDVVKTPPIVLEKKKHSTVLGRRASIEDKTERKLSDDVTPQQMEAKSNRRNSREAITGRRSSKEILHDNASERSNDDVTYKRRSSRELLSPDTPPYERRTSGVATSGRRSSKESVQSLQSTFERRASGEISVPDMNRRSSRELLKGTVSTSTTKDRISSTRRQSSDSTGSSANSETQEYDGRRKNSAIEIDKVLSRTNSQEASIQSGDIPTPPAVPGNIDIGKLVTDDSKPVRKTSSNRSDSLPTSEAKYSTGSSTTISTSRAKSARESSRSSSKASEFSSKFWGTSDSSTPNLTHGRKTPPGERRSGSAAGTRTPPTTTLPGSKTVVRQGITAMMASKFGSKENDGKQISPTQSPKQQSPSTSRISSSKTGSTTAHKSSNDNGANIIQSKIQEITMKFGQSPGADSPTKKHVTLSNKTRDTSSTGNSKTFTISSIRSSAKDGKAASSPFEISLKPTGSKGVETKRTTPTTKITKADKENVAASTKPRRSVTSIDAPVNGDLEGERLDKFPEKSHATAVSRSKSLRRKTSQGSPSSPRKTYRKLYVTHVRGSKSIDVETDAPSDVAEVKQDVEEDGLKVKLLVKCKDLKV